MKRILYTAIGSIFGLTCGITWDLLFSSRTVVVSTWPAELNAPLVLWGLAGMVMGGRAVDPLAIERGDNRDSGPFYPLQIETQPARCAWRHGQGRRLIFFLCPVCGGQGHMLIVRPKKKCAGCHGTGRRFLGRCRACGGSGWLQPNPSYGRGRLNAK